MDNPSENYLNSDALALERDGRRPTAPAQRPLPENLEEYLSNRNKQPAQNVAPDGSGISWFNTVFLPILIIAGIFVVSGFVFNKMRTNTTEEFDLEARSEKVVDFHTEKGKIPSTTMASPLKESITNQNYTPTTVEKPKPKTNFAPSYVLSRNPTTEINGISVNSPKDYLKYSVINGVMGNGENSRISLNGSVYGKFDIVDENLGLFFIGVVSDQNKAYFKDVTGKVYAMRY